MTPSGQTPAPGTYKFVSRSTSEAVAVVRERLGAGARVLSVRTVPAPGLRRFLSRPQLEIIVEVGGADAAGAPAPGRIDLASTEPARPDGASPSESEPSRARPGVSEDKRPVADAGDLTGLLRRSGLSATTLERLQAKHGWSELSRLPLHRALAETSRLLQAQAERRPAAPALTRAAFIGAPGIGRTTALCKRLAQEVFRRGRVGHVVAVEFERPNPLGPLPVFSEALGVPLAHFPCETRPALPGGFVFIDLPGLCPSSGRPGNAALAEFLDREAIEQRVLVLNAAYDRAALREAHATGRALGATHLVFTHLDEVPQWGKLWDYLFDEALEPLFLSTGPSLTGDCEEDVTAAIARRTLPEER